MKKLAIKIFFVSMVAFVAAYAVAQDENPNGFPSGPHYNMNIHGKKVGFICPQQEYAEDGVTPIYGNSVFVPEFGGGSILMQSGRVGKKASGFTELQAVDPCSSEFDGDPAVIQLPPNADGYRVYARALAKPGPDTSITIIPSLVSASDEFGDPLIYLGLVSSNGVFLSSGETITRTGAKSKAVPITDLFMWSGTVCTPYADTATQICVRDADGDGIAEDVVLPVDGACPLAEPAYTLIDTYCNTYDQPTWVFNIADFVEYLWSLDNSATKLLQIRFYPN